MKDKIRAINLTHMYGEQEVFRDLNFEIMAKDFISIMGESGNGKSTLLSLLSGSLKPTKGDVFYDNNNICLYNDKQLSVFRKNEIGYVYQFYNLIPTLNVRDNIMLPLYLKKVEKKQYIKSFDELVEILDIKKLLDKYPDKLSGGEQQRVAIARSVIYEPDVLMLDEPTGNLDSKNTIIIMDLIKEINCKKNITVIQVTHSHKVAEYGNKIFQLEDGKLITIE
ncbi:MAG: ABC transporter ATP-binding protein [Clostridia bacterium]